MTNENGTDAMLTPPELAKRWRVNPEKILQLIRNGELIAVNLATSKKGRPRYKITVEEIARFEEARSTKHPTPKRRSKRKAEKTPRSSPPT